MFDFGIESVAIHGDCVTVTCYRNGSLHDFSNYRARATVYFHDGNVFEYIAPERLNGETPFPWALLKTTKWGDV